MKTHQVISNKRKLTQFMKKIPPKNPDNKHNHYYAKEQTHIIDKNHFSEYGKIYSLEELRNTKELLKYAK